MERGTEIISAVIETTLLSGMVDRQHDREHASADAFDVDESKEISDEGRMTGGPKAAV